MDWSLVLASQEIETAIDRDAETGWSLLVSDRDHDRALAVLQQYEKENPRWPWRQRAQGLLFDWGSAGWVLLAGIFFWAQQWRPALHDAGVMDGGAVSRGEWWRLFTATWLHADPGHLAANAGIGLLLLGLAMGRYGTGIGLLAASLAGAGGNVTTWLVFGDAHRSLGASGMVMGCVGLLAAQSLAISRKNPLAKKYAATGLIGGGLLFVLIGLTPGTDVLAHAGGFATGALLGALLTFAPRLAQNRAANLFSGALFLLLVLLPWWLALR